jgi:hypothetical protein
MRNRGTFTINLDNLIGVKMIDDKKFMHDVNSLIIEKLKKYPHDVQELGLQAIRLSESYQELAVAEQLQSIVRKLSKQKEGKSL